MTFRAAGRLGWFTFEVLVILLNYLFTNAFAPQKSKRLARAAWLHRSSRRHLKIFGYSADVTGAIPKNGLLISNHLSYLDILAISATTSAVFVSKADVRRWPLAGPSSFCPKARVPTAKPSCRSAPRCWNRRRAADTRLPPARFITNWTTATRNRESATGAANRFF